MSCVEFNGLRFLPHTDFPTSTLCLESTEKTSFPLLTLQNIANNDLHYCFEVPAQKLFFLSIQSKRPTVGCHNIGQTPSNGKERPLPPNLIQEEGIQPLFTNRPPSFLFNISIEISKDFESIANQHFPSMHTPMTQTPPYFYNFFLCSITRLHQHFKTSTPILQTHVLKTRLEMELSKLLFFLIGKYYLVFF